MDDPDFLDDAHDVSFETGASDPAPHTPTSPVEERAPAVTADVPAADPALAHPTLEHPALEHRAAGQPPLEHPALEHPAVQRIAIAVAALRGAAAELADAAASLAEHQIDADSAGHLADAVVSTVECERSVVNSRLSLLAACTPAKPWIARGHTAPTKWLAHDTRRSRGECRTEVSAANSLGTTPEASQRMAAGQIGLDQLRMIQKTAALDGGRWAKNADEMLSAMAAGLEHDDFGHAIEHWHAWAEPDTHAAKAKRAEEKRSFHLSPSKDGIVFAAGQFTGLGGVEIRNEVDRLIDIETAADWAEARCRMGAAASYADLERSPTQRRADAMLEMARRSASTTQPGEPAPVELSLLMSWATWCAELDHLELDADHGVAHTGRSAQRPTEPPDLPQRPGHPDGPTKRVCETLDGQVLAPSAAINAALGGHVRRVVVGPSGNILDFGRAKRFFTGALRKAIKIRDRHCVAPGCRIPARQCEADHREAWSDGGSTTEENGDLYCPHHHPGNRQHRPPNEQPPP